jgi:type II secretory pathway component PulC
MMRLARRTTLALLVTATAVLANEPVKSDGSNLGITIMGAIIQKAAADNVALIKDSAGAVKAVKRDHVILDKYKVVAVTAQYVELITRDSKRYFVYQDKFADMLAVKTVASGPGLGGAPDQFKEDGFERDKGKIKMTAIYRDRLVKEDLAKVLMQATAEPFVENGAIVGFKMSQIDPDTIYSKSGVVDGDVITSINGQELNSVAGAISLLKTLKGAEHVDVEVRRGSGTQKISVDVN